MDVILTTAIILLNYRVRKIKFHKLSEVLIFVDLSLTTVIILLNCQIRKIISFTN